MTLVSGERAISHLPADGQMCRSKAAEPGPSLPGTHWRMLRSNPRLLYAVLEPGAEVDKSITKLYNIAYAAQQPLR